MNYLLHIAKKAQHSNFYRWLLNRMLWWLIPFNRNHRVYIEELSDHHVLIRLPYIKSNQNHLKGIHACALATLCEYACGIGLMTHLDPQSYRIILKDIQLNFHAQGRKDVYARFTTTPDFLKEEIMAPLEQLGHMSKTFKVEAYTIDQPSICTAHVTWQLKHWNKVRRV